MKPNAHQQTWNAPHAIDEGTVLATRNKPAPPSGSWWLNLDRQQLSDAVQRETPRMAGSPCPSVPRAFRKVTG